jgi:Uma2 family endonuclease
MSVSLFHRPGPWTVDDLDDLPDDGNRYELVDGSLVVSPAPAKPHLRTVSRLHRLLVLQAPEGYAVGENGGVATTSKRTYFIPDLFVTEESALEGTEAAFRPDEVRLAVEVLSPGNRGTDLVLKRHYYAEMRIPQYWIVDPKTRTLTVLTLDGDRYGDEFVVKAGQRWRTEEPFPLELDPAEFC